MTTTGPLKAFGGLALAAMLLAAVGAQQPEMTSLTADEARLRVATVLGLQEVSSESGLEGVRRIKVAVEPMKDEEFAQFGITEESLRTHVELELRKIGIAIDSKYGAPEVAMLGITVGVEIVQSNDNRERIYFFTVRLDLFQSARLYRDPRFTLPVAITWSRGILGVYDGSKSLNEGVKTALGGLLTQFLNDYLAANPINPSGR